MSTFNLLIILAVWAVMVALVAAVLFVYFRGRGGEGIPGKTGLLTRFRQRTPFRKPTAASDQAPAVLGGSAVPSHFGDSYDYRGTFPRLESARETSSNPLSELYRKIGKKQRVAGIGFVVASISFLVLSIPLKGFSLVLEIDSVVSFAVAVILFLKENRERVQSRVLNAVVMSLGTTIAELSSRTGSGFLYVPSGESISKVTLVGTSKGQAGEGFTVVPPGMGLAELFSREAGSSITPESLKHLLPSVLKENFGIADGVEVSSTESRVEVLLRRPAIFCSCQKDGTSTSGVVGCTVSSFLAVLYSFGSQKVLALDRCMTDTEAKTWRISMNLQGSAA